MAVERLSRGDLDDVRLAAKRDHALKTAAAAIKALAALGVTAELIGSLKEQRFDQTSDVDFLITKCPRSLKYAVESVVEDCLPGLSFDVLYLDEISEERASLYREAADALRSHG